MGAIVPLNSRFVCSASSRLTKFKPDEYDGSMQSVESIIKDVFGNQVSAAKELGVKPSAVSNWKSWGYFPPRLVLPIWQAAKDRGIQLEPDEIPAIERKAIAS